MTIENAAREIADYIDEDWVQIPRITEILSKHFQPESAGWQTIESAPKDGTWIVVVGPLKEKDNPTWRDMPRACVSAYFTEETRKDSPSFCAGWCYSAPGYSSLIEPTHWMPLPLPQESKTKLVEKWREREFRAGGAATMDGAAFRDCARELEAALTAPQPAAAPALADALYLAKPDALGGLSLTQEQAVAVAGFVYQHFPAHQPEAARVKGRPSGSELLSYDDVCDAVQGALCELGRSDRMASGELVRVFCNRMAWGILNELCEKLGCQAEPFPFGPEPHHADAPAVSGESRIIGRPDKPFHKPECLCDDCMAWRLANRISDAPAVSGESERPIALPHDFYVQMIAAMAPTIPPQEDAESAMHRRAFNAKVKEALPALLTAASKLAEVEKLCEEEERMYKQLEVEDGWLGKNYEALVSAREIRAILNREATNTR